MWQNAGNLAGRWVPGPVWNDIRQIAELSDQNDLSQVFQKMLKAWKVSKTALSPVTHTNNVMSNNVVVVCTNLYLLAGGKIVESGSASDVIDRPQVPRTQQFLSRLMA